MELRRRSPILALAVLTASLLALVFAGSALAATQNFGPYEVTDAVTHDGSGDTATTTATYTITVPEDPSSDVTSLAATNAAPFVQAISHVDVGVCNDLADRTYTIQRDTGGGAADFGSFEKNGDPSVNNLTTPIIKWDGNQDTGTTYIYSYTVPGTWDSVPTTLYIKSGSYGNTRDPHDPFSGTVQGIACANTPPGDGSTPPGGGTTTTTTSGAVAGQQIGQQQVLGERVEAGTARLAGASGCQRKAFRVKVSGKQIRKVVFTIDGKRVKKVSASASGTVYSITVHPNSYKAGSHLVTAKVTFTAASNTRSKTMRVRFARCIRTTAPAFTG
jgi:hypothetical protein